MSKTIEITLRINVEIEDDSAINHPIIVDFDQEHFDDNSFGNYVEGMFLTGEDSIPLNFRLNEYETVLVEEVGGI